MHVPTAVALHDTQIPDTLWWHVIDINIVSIRVHESESKALVRGGDSADSAALIALALM